MGKSEYGMTCTVLTFLLMGAAEAALPSSLPCTASPPRFQTITATGVGYPPPGKKDPQARLLARRAAEVVAVRNLRRKANRLGATVRSFRYVSSTRRSNGSFQVIVQADIPHSPRHHSGALRK